MSYYQDLTPYNYHHHSIKELNVGWLDKNFPFEKGEVPAGFLNNLKKIAEHQVFQTRGFHFCDFCREQVVDGKIKCATSSSELRVIGKNGISYASPQMIVHYIEDHQYLPPKEFVDAVMDGIMPGSPEYDEVFKRLPESWERRKPDANDEDYEEKLKKEMVQNLSESIDNKIIKDLLEQNADFQKFVEAYNKIMPPIYAVGFKNKKS